MNYRGSYRRLVANSKSAMVGAIEIYNKPRFDYRDEVFVLLLINAFELLLKAIVSKGNKSIFEKKKRNQPYRTINWRTAMTRAVSTAAWPTPIPYRAVEENLELLSVYRDNAVHFYNAPGFGVVIYSLAQTSIVNYRDILRAVFGQELADEINWQLMPLGVTLRSTRWPTLVGLGMGARRARPWTSTSRPSSRRRRSSRPREWTLVGCLPCST
jgi:hypothetical protein